MRQVAKIITNHSKNCFVKASVSLLKSIGVDIDEEDSTNDLLTIVKVIYDGQVAYLSAVATKGVVDEVHLNLLLANNLLLRDNQLVFVDCVRETNACMRANIEPVSVDDWEILELHAAQVESNLLDQVRVVWPGQVFPLWVDNGAVCIFLRTVDVQPNTCDFAVLMPLTELIVAPKINQSNRFLTSGKKKCGLFGGSTAGGGGSTAGGDGLTAGGDGSTAGEDGSTAGGGGSTAGEDGSTAGGDGSTAGEDGSTAGGDGSTDNSAGIKDASTGVEDATTVSSPTIKHLSIIYQFLGWVRSSKFARVFNFIFIYIPRLAIRRLLIFFTSLINFKTEPVVASSNQPIHQQPAVDILTELPEDFDLVMRVEQVIESDQAPDTIFIGDGELLHDQPGAVFLHLSHLEPSDQCDIRIIKLTKLPSPTDQDRSTTTAVVQVYIHPLNHLNLSLNCPNLLSTHRLKLTRLLRRQLNIGVTSRVRLHRVTNSSLRDCSDLFSITLQVRTTPTSSGLFDRGIASQSLHLAFQRWLTTYSDVTRPLPIAIGTLFGFHVDDVTPVECCVTKLERRDGGMISSSVAHLLSIGSLRALRVDFQLDSVTTWPPDDVDPFTPPPAPCIAFDDDVDEITRFVEQGLGARPISDVILRLSPRCHRRTLLVTGSRGSGKTSICSHVLRNFRLDPLVTAYVAMVTCSEWRGKKSDSIARRFEQLADELLWRQPSIVLLDDLHLLATSQSRHEGANDDLYDSQLARVVIDFFRRVDNAEGSRVVVIATAKSRETLHQSLTTNHLFHHFVNLQLPDARQRDVIITSLLPSTTSLSHIQQLVDATEGFAPIDFQRLLRRARHASRDRVVDVTHLQTSLIDFTPSSLHDVKLHEPPRVSWDDVGGLQEVKQRLVEQLLWPVRYRQLFRDIGFHSNAGVLLYGPAGCGKTLLATAVANLCQLHFISVKGPELLSRYIGASEAAVRDLFTRASAAAPCVLFFDEFDSLAPRRGRDSTGVTDRVVNQLLTQLDGVEPLKGVTVVAATNRPDLLDPALLRPGRFDHHFFIPRPDVIDRRQILATLSSHLLLDDDVDMMSLARDLDEFTGADIKAFLYNAQLDAIHSRVDDVTTPIATDELSVEDIYIEAESFVIHDDNEKVMTSHFVDDVTDTAAALIASEVTSSRRCDANYFPSVVSGSGEIDDARIADEIDVIIGSGDVTKRTSENACKIRISKSNLRHAMSVTKPSLSGQRRLELDLMFQQFGNSREDSLQEKKEDFVSSRVSLS